MIDLEMGKEKFTLELTNREHIPELIEIEKSVAGTKIYSPMLEENEWREEFEKGVFIYFIKKGDKIVGNTSYEKRRDGSIYISGLAIAKQFQNQSIGREALKLLLELEVVGEAKRIDLVTHPENKTALKLYKSFGFKIESRKENYYGDGEPRLVLALNRKE